MKFVSPFAKAKNVDLEGFKETTTNGARFVVTASEFKEASMTFEGEYERGEELEGSIEIKTPFAGYEKLGAEASIEFKSPTEFDFKVKVIKNTPVFEFNAGFGMTGDKKVLKFTVVAPELGLNANDLSIELVFKKQHLYTSSSHSQGQRKLDFEVGVLVALKGQRNEAKIKFERDDMNQPPSFSTPPVHEVDFAGEFVLYSDWLKQGPFGMAFDHISDLTLKFGYQESSNSVPVLGGDGRISHNKIYRVYLNQNEVNFEMKETGTMKGTIMEGQYFESEGVQMEIGLDLDALA